MYKFENFVAILLSAIVSTVNGKYSYGYCYNIKGIEIEPKNVVGRWYEVIKDRFTET